MKLKILSFWLPLLFVLVGCAEKQVSFLDPEEGKGVPEISRIIDANTLNEVSSVLLEQTLILEGKHLTSVKKIVINDVEARVGHEAQVIKNRVYVTIPYVKPEVITDKLVLTSDYGTVEKALVVSVPPLVAGDLSNEFALPGEEVELKGNCYDLYGVIKGAKVLVGSQETTVSFANKTTVRFTIPQSALPNTEITLKGLADYKVHAKYRTADNIVDNFEPGNGSWRTANIVPNATYPAPLTPQPTQGSQYCRFTKSVGSWAWNDVQTIGYTYLPDMTSNASKWVIKMEVYTIKPLNGGGIKAGMAAGDGLFAWLWSDGSKTLSASDALDTKGKWQTITLPFEWAQGKSGTSFGLITHSPIVGTTNWEYDFCVDNIRLEKLP